MSRADHVTVGLLRDDEVEALQLLAEAIWRINYKALISPEQIEYMLSQRYQPELLRQLLARGDRLFAARAGGELVGFAHVFRADDSHCKLDKLYVRHDLQRHGIGAQLLGAVEDYARGQSCEHLSLRVNKHNQQALAAYQKYGFSHASDVIEDIGGGFVMDDYVLTKTL
jgi:GNAT superfamily N-acetyltransferase